METIEINITIGVNTSLSICQQEVKNCLFPVWNVQTGSFIRQRWLWWAHPAFESWYLVACSSVTNNFWFIQTWNLYEITHIYLTLKHCLYDTGTSIFVNKLHLCWKITLYSNRTRVELTDINKEMTITHSTKLW